MRSILKTLNFVECLDLWPWSAVPTPARKNRATISFTV